MFSGSIVALITPMNKKGKIDWNSLKKLIFYHIENKTDAILITGITGEIFTLTKREQFQILEFVLKISKHRIPIILGLISSSTSEIIFLLKNKINKSGVDACLILSPHGNQPKQIGIYNHYYSISRNSNIPIIIYNAPKRVGVDISPETISKLSRLNNIIGIKDAHEDLKRVNEIKNVVDKSFLLFSGEDKSLLDFIQLGGQGVISVTANVAASKIANICTLARNGNFEKARKENSDVVSLHNHLFIEPNPIPIKWVCKKLRLITSDTLRLPLTSLSKKSKKTLYKVLKNSKLL